MSVLVTLDYANRIYGTQVSRQRHGEYIHEVAIYLCLGSELPAVERTSQNPANAKFAGSFF
jgi:hypothetical protein